MLEKTANFITPAHVSHDFIRYEEHYDYGQIGKGFIHVYGIPFIIAFFAPQYSLVYIACVALMYSTVFRAKSEGFFTVLGFSVAIIALLVLAV